MKKKIVLPLLLSSLFALVSCDNEEEIIIGSKDTHNSSAWFTNEELKAVGLAGMSAPTGLTGALSSDIHWFNDGYAFNQACPSEDVMKENAQKYFDYFKANYEGRFGTATIHATSADFSTYWYYILPKTNLEDYHETNPSSLYKFYYVKDTELVDGYLKESAVWSFDIRYETSSTVDGYLLKIFIENASAAHNGAISYKYTLKA